MENEKVLNFNEMEEIVGGQQSDYCKTMQYWYDNNLDGFQGDEVLVQWFYLNYYKYCR